MKSQCAAVQGPACTGGLPASLTAPFSNPFRGKAPQPLELQLFEAKPECPLRYDRSAAPTQQAACRADQGNGSLELVGSCT